MENNAGRQLGTVARAAAKDGWPRPGAQRGSGHLRAERFVTLLGPGGIGKTTIAVAAGHGIAEEVRRRSYFTDLGSLADPDLVVRGHRDVTGTCPEIEQ